jgi:CDP-diacylglycerol--glycerol-3-phosphate 3-phosphatidyltransferase
MTPDVHGDGRSGDRARGVARGLIPDWLDDRFTRSVTPVIRRLILARVNPNAITVTAFVLTASGGILIAFGHLIGAFLLIVVGGVLDFSDGKVAALTGRVTTFGGILDSTLDRYADAAVYLGLTVFFWNDGHGFTAVAAVLALVGSMTSSYLMALGKAYGYGFRTGILRRQDRVTLIASAFRLYHMATVPLAPVVWVLAALTNVTALQRLLVLRRLAQGEHQPPIASETLRDRQLRALRDSIGRTSTQRGTNG